MQVVVHEVRMAPNQTVVEGVGVDIATGDEILFGGDWRPMLVLAEAILTEGEALAEVPEWAVLVRL